MVALILKIVITQNINCDNLVGFPKSGHILFSNQAHAGLWLAHTWFLKIHSVKMSECVRVFVCASAPGAINN